MAARLRNLVITACLVLIFIPFGAGLKRSVSSDNDNVVAVVSVQNPAEYGLGPKTNQERSSSVDLERSNTGSTDIIDAEIKERIPLADNSERLTGLVEDLESVGCYDVWENKTDYLHDSVMPRNSLTSCSSLCESLYSKALIPREYIVGVRGSSCFCPYMDTFDLVRVSDDHCPIDCYDLEPSNSIARGEKTCGGSYTISAYCPKSTGKCEPFKYRPVKDLYAEIDEPQPELTTQLTTLNEGQRQVEGPTKFPFCANCSICEGTLRVLYDYIANHTTADVCVRFCRRRITNYDGLYELKTREPTKYAVFGWAIRATDTTVPTCGCTDDLEKLTAVDNQLCDKQCDDGSYCGSDKLPNIGTVYSTESGKPTDDDGDTTTTPSPSTQETTTQAPPPQTECGDRKQCRGHDPYGQPWTACAGDTRTDTCPNGATGGGASWKCLETGQFDGPSPIYTNCTTQWVQQLDAALEDGTATSALKILVTVEDMCTKAKDLENTEAQYFGHEIVQILSMVEAVIKDTKLTEETSLPEFEELANTVTFIGDSVLTNARTWAQLSGSALSHAVSTFLRTLEESSFQLAEKAQSCGRSDYSKSFLSDMISSMAGLTSVDANSNETLKFESGGSYIELPPGWQKVFPPTVKYGSQFSGLGIVTVKSNPFPSNISGLTGEEDTKDFNGRIMGFSLTRPTDNATITFPDAGVYIRIQHDVVAWGNGQQRKEIRRKLHAGEQTKAILGSGVCAYWDTKLGVWSQQGCKLIASDSDVTQCECSHLTSFAVLFSYYDYVEKSLPLEVLTIVLCSLSVVCLLATIVIFTVVTTTHGTRTTITKNLAFCLLIGNVLMLLVVDRNYFDMSEDFCAGAGIVTHYIFLCAFMWMAIEGYHLYKMMVHVFDSGHSRLRILRIIGYGFPLLIVIVTGVIGVSMNQKPYGGEEFCWLNEQYALAFIVPVGIVVFGNFVVLVITLRTAYSVRSSPSQIHDRKRSFRTWIRGCFSITLLLGTTWVVGYIQMLAIGSVVSEVAAYIFTILNASQGFLLFIYHCLLNEKVRMAAERRNIRYPAWLSDPSSTTNTNTSGGASMKNNSRFGRQNAKSFYSDSTGKPEMKFGGGGPLERFGSHNSVQLGLDRNSKLNGLSYPIKRGSVQHGTVSSSCSTGSSTVGSGSDTNQSQNDLLPELRRHRHLI